MRVYADSSFILRLVCHDPESAETMAEYRRAGRPDLFLLPLHELEVTNGIYQRAFYKRRSVDAAERKAIAREREAALARYHGLIKRRGLVSVTVDNDIAHKTAMGLALKHTERIGTKAIDLLHVACALTLQAELFFTADERQTDLARAAGLRVG